MATTRRLSTREKTILGVTVCVLVAAVAYNGFFAGFLDNYREVSQNLEKARKDYNVAKDLLKNADAVDREYETIAATLSKREPGKRPEMVFTEDVASVCRKLNVMPPPTINPHKTEPVTGVAGFHYLILPVVGINGDLSKIIAVLLEFYRQHFLIQKLLIKYPPMGSRRTELTMEVELAQIVRSEDLGIAEGTPEASGETGSVGVRAAKEAKKSIDVDMLEKE